MPKGFIALIGTIVWLIVGGPGAPGVIRAAGQIAVDDEITALERAEAAAVVSRDLATLQRIYAEDFRFTHGTGEVQGKAEWMAELRAGERRYPSREHEVLEVERHGDVAVTYGVLRIRREMAGLESQFLARYVRVYVRRANQWQMISHRTVEQREVK